MNKKKNNKSTSMMMLCKYQSNSDAFNRDNIKKYLITINESLSSSSDNSQYLISSFSLQKHFTDFKFSTVSFKNSYDHYNNVN